jgi:hypothetical protein
MYTRFLFPGLLTVGTLLLTGCGLTVVRGSGRVVTETRPASDFNRVELVGSGEVVVTQGDQEALAVAAEDNLLSHLRTEVRGHTLYLGLRPDTIGEMIVPTQPITYYVSLKTVEALTLSGSGNIRAAQVDAGQLDLNLTGSGNITLDTLTAQTVRTRITGSGNCRLGGGTTQTQTVDIGGSGNYTSDKLQSQTSTVTITGSGEAALWAQDTLQAGITGSGNVRYYGRPQVTQHVTGSGKIEALAMR